MNIQPVCRHSPPHEPGTNLPRYECSKRCNGVIDFRILIDVVICLLIEVGLMLYGQLVIGA